MKRNLIVASLGALAMGALFSASAGAQTCAAPLAWQPDATGNPPISGTTCGGDTTAGGYCGGNFDAPGPAYVIKSTFAASRTFQKISLTGSGFDPVIYMSRVSDGCGVNAGCGPTGDPGAPISTADVPDGDWFIIVTAANFDSAGACGTFNASTEGTFPVTLQNFTVS